MGSVPSSFIMHSSLLLLCLLFSGSIALPAELSQQDRALLGDLLGGVVDGILNGDSQTTTTQAPTFYEDLMNLLNALFGTPTTTTSTTTTTTTTTTTECGGLIGFGLLCGPTTTTTTSGAPETTTTEATTTTTETPTTTRCGGLI